MRSRPRGWRRSVDREKVRAGYSAVRNSLRDADAVRRSGRPHPRRRYREVCRDPARSQTPCTYQSTSLGNREILIELRRHSRTFSTKARQTHQSPGLLAGEGARHQLRAVSPGRALYKDRCCRDFGESECRCAEKLRGFDLSEVVCTKSLNSRRCSSVMVVRKYWISARRLRTATGPRHGTGDQPRPTV
jgi:hypothetical protein